MPIIKTKIGQHQGEVAYGAGRVSEAKVNYLAPISANVTCAFPRRTGMYLPKGRIVHLNDLGEFETGLPTAKPVCLPFMLHGSDSDDFDVQHDTGDMFADPNAYAGGSPTTNANPVYAQRSTGNAVALAVVAGEIYTSSEWDKLQEAAYVPNTPLTAVFNNDDNAQGGLIVPGVIGTDHIFGIVIKLLRHSGTLCVMFQGLYIPPTAATP